jgi:RNA-directed DNA polymerase
MYHHPNPKCKHISSDRRSLRNNGIAPKYLTKYCDDWTILTTTKDEAEKFLKYLKKYFKHKLKLELSEEKTVITNLLEDCASFLGCIVKAALPRVSPERPNPDNTVGKHYPDICKLKQKVKDISKEIKLLRYMSNQKKVVQIEKINGKITGIAEYYKTSICSNAFSYIDDKVYKSSYSTFSRMYGKKYKDYV